MKLAVTDRCVTRRHSCKAPLRVRIWKSAILEQQAESQNLSEKGVFFARDSLLRVGTAVEILPRVPQEIAAEAATERLCTGHIVRAEAINSLRGKLGVGALFDCHPILRAATV